MNTCLTLLWMVFSNSQVLFLSQSFCHLNHIITGQCLFKVHVILHIKVELHFNNSILLHII